jgi:hypothetical protein
MPQGPIPTQLFAQTQLPTANTSTPVQLGKTKDLLVGQLHSPYYEPAYGGTVMQGANPYASAVTTSAALATTYLGICLSNPAGSSVNLVLSYVSAMFVVAPAALTAVGLITGYAAGGITAHTTALTPQNAFLNGAAPVAKLDSACTLVGTPVWAMWLAVNSATTTAISNFTKADGVMIIPPGGYVAVGTSIAGPASGFVGSMVWEEVAV